MLKKKLLDFTARISDVEQINPLFSTCTVRVLYTGENRNMTYLSKEAVEKALPTLKNIPIVGEFSEESGDYKGHGGAIDLDSYKYVHTTKPYGVVPESATYEWEEINGKEYLTINGCYLWTGRYEEANEVINNGKGQSMEIEVVDGEWDEELDLYVINSFIFSAFCILGDNVEPAFEEASITTYSLNKDEFKSEFTKMLGELKFSLNGNISENKKEDGKMLKELLEKYSLTVEQLTEKGINFDEISEDELEAEIVKAFEIEEEQEEGKEADTETETEEQGEGEEEQEEEPKAEEEQEEQEEAKEENDEVDFELEVSNLKKEIDKLEKAKSDMDSELNELREFKANVLKKEHEQEAQKIFDNFQLKEEDVKDLDIHKYSIDEIEEKCYAILGKKLASKKNFSKDKNKDNTIRLEINSDNETDDSPYGGLFEKFKNK